MELTLDTDVLAARTGDRDAFARLVTRYGGVVTAISLSTVRNVATSEEIAQEVFLAAWRDLASLRNPSSFLPWLRQLTRHRAIDAVRRRRRPDGDAALNEEALVAAIDPRPGADDALLRDERAAAVSAALDALPDEAREVLTLYYREGQSVTQVALLLGLREDTVKKRLSRARGALREEVLARFAGAVEASAPGDALARQVMLALPMTSPAAAIVVGKGVLHLVAKWAAFAAVSVAGLVGLVCGGVPMVAGIRREMRDAIDERERRDLTRLGVAATANLAVFSLGLPLIQRATSPQARLPESLFVLAFTAVHMGIYAVWLPRVKARRRSAAAAADGRVAERYAREDRRSVVWASIASGVILAVTAAAWMR